MEIVIEPGQMQARARAWEREVSEAPMDGGAEVGLVATMGALHEGHMDLVRQARRECGRVVASVFVNPTQFGPSEDLSRYPRPFERDREMLESAGVDVLFAPTPLGMYGVESLQQWLKQPHASVRVSGLGDAWEGEARPGHMEGVATVVAKLLNATLSTSAYFGEKDFQQLRVIEKMVADLLFPVSIVAVPTAREPDGLALSSRNAYLSPQERLAAPALHRALGLGAEMSRQGERDAATLEEAMRAVIREQPLASLQYLAVVDPRTLEPVQVLEAPGQARTLVAAKIGATRLIDNAPI